MDLRLHARGGRYGARMVRRRGIDGPPVAYVVSGQWPDVTAATHEAQVVADIAAGLADALADRGLRDVARDADLAHTTIRDLLAGHAWPDVVTVARLERALGRRLWPTRRT